MKNNKSHPVLSRGKKIVFSLIAAGIALFILIIGAELLIRFLAPQETLFPRWDYSREFGGLWPENATIVNQCPGRWRFVYRTNQFGFRGEAVLPGEENGKENIVVLGDSFSFGSGVNEGEEYPAVIRERLGNRYNVINIAVPGWGLTHQIKMFYRFGRL